MTTQLVLDALEQAIWTRQREGKDLAGLIAHHDHVIPARSALRKIGQVIRMFEERPA